MGPVISPESKQRIERLIESGIKQVGPLCVMLLCLAAKRCPWALGNCCLPAPPWHALQPAPTCASCRIWSQDSPRPCNPASPWSASHHCLAQGARCDLDGRGVQVTGYPHGNWVGPTLLSGVQPHMECYQEEIFGPVLVCLEVRAAAQGADCVLGATCLGWLGCRPGRPGPAAVLHAPLPQCAPMSCPDASPTLPPPPSQVDTLDEAIALINANEHGNGTAIFTGSGAASRRFQSEVDVGMVSGRGCGGSTAER